MEEFRNPIILGFIVVYMLLMVLVGIWAIKRTKSTRDFFMAGRNLGVMVTAFAIFSTTLSGFGFVGGPGLVYQMGMSSVWIFVCVIMGFNLSFFLLAKRLRLLAELGDCISLPDIIALRYNHNTTQILAAVAILLGVLGYLASQILAMAIVLKDILNETAVFNSVSLELCLVISASILLFYSVTGGIVASVYTDLIQGIIMVVAAILVFITVVGTYDGGLTEISMVIQADDREAIGPWGTMGMVGCLSWFFVFCWGRSRCIDCPRESGRGGFHF
jgi:Na+/proline symporter